MSENLKNETDDLPAAKPEKAANEMSEAEMDETIAESFPASDAPSWTLGTNHRAAAESEAKKRERQRDFKPES
jgi:hypothetical protein